MVAVAASTSRRIGREPRTFIFTRGALLLVHALLGTALLPPVAVEAQYDTIDGHPCFRNLDGMTQSMFDLAEQYPNLVTINDIGDSYTKQSGPNRDFDLPEDGYDIYAMNITSRDGMHASSTKGKMLVISGVHAREYAPPALNMKFAETLVEGYGVDPDITWILQHNEVHLIIYVNPDGRYVAENHPDLYWRKNLNPSGGCNNDEDYGVDLNRQYDFWWGDQDGASDDPCDSDYHGKSPETEPEVQAVVTYAKQLFPEEQRKDDPEGDMDVALGEGINGMFVDIHSSGGYIYFPWGHEKNKFSPDDESFQALGRKLRYYNGYKFWAPGSSDFLYPTSGDSTDYAYGVLGVASFGLELGEDFYESCGRYEDEVVPLNLPALLYAAKIAKQPFSLVKGPDITDIDLTSDLFLTVTASDSMMAGGEPTGDQDVTLITAYLDVHPDDYTPLGLFGCTTAWEVSSITSSRTSNAQLQISLPDCVSSGRHTLFAQATDSAGYAGPVSSIFFDVERAETSPPSKGPTAQPTKDPTPAPSLPPSPPPSPAPSPAPTEAPTTVQPTPSPSTSMPSRRPSMAPSTQPTNSPSSAPTSASPTLRPSLKPSSQPSPSPSLEPSANPSEVPSYMPSVRPTQVTYPPTRQPTLAPTTTSPVASTAADMSTTAGTVFVDAQTDSASCAVSPFGSGALFAAAVILLYLM